MNGSDELTNTTAFNKTSNAGTLFTFERYVKIVIPVFYGLIFVLGIVGNLLVIIVVVRNKRMRNVHNTLIVCLALVDLSFIMVCVPFTAADYTMEVWPFGEFVCKVKGYLIYVSAYASVYTLLLMTFSRYIAILYPVSSMAYMTSGNIIKLVMIMWFIILSGNMPLLQQVTVVHYTYMGENRSECLNKEFLGNPATREMFYFVFFVYGYLVPLTVMCVLYGLILNRLHCTNAIGEAARPEGNGQVKKATRMIVIVVLVFAICWLPIQVMLVIDLIYVNYTSIHLYVNYTSIHTQVAHMIAHLIFNCLAYANSCLNPILYAFLSIRFRQGFREALCCCFLSNPRSKKKVLESNTPSTTVAI